MQGIVYNLNTMHSRAGSQVPFSSINLGIPKGENEQQEKDAAMICKVFLEEYEKGLGKKEQPIFPNIVFRVKSGINRDRKSTRLNSSHANISYAVFCLKKNKYLLHTCISSL